jgi:hypothetical protein
MEEINKEKKNGRKQKGSYNSSKKSGSREASWERPNG